MLSIITVVAIIGLVVLGWNILQPKMRARLLQSQRVEMMGVIQKLSLKDNETIGDLVRTMVLCRWNFFIDGSTRLPSGVLGETDADPSLEQFILADLMVKRLFRQVTSEAKNKSVGEMMRIAVKMWLYTISMRQYPELCDLGPKLWGVLRRGIPSAKEEFAKMNSKAAELPIQLPPNLLEMCDFIPRGW